MPRFQHTEYLFLLAIIPVAVALYVIALRRKKAVAKKLGDPGLVKLLTSRYNAGAYFTKFMLLVSAMFLLVIAVANLRTPVGSQKISRNGIDIMIALDVSKSMLAQDVKPTRLDRAKQVLSRLVDRLDNDRVGIVIFAGKAYLQMPLTGDHSSAKMYINSASTESVPTQGTVIADALRMCAASFNAEEKKYKAVVLISDGEDHDEEALKAATAMTQEGIAIYTVGIGSLQGTPLPDETTGQAKTDQQGNVVISKLNEKELQSIAAKGNGKYQLYQSTDVVVRNLVSELSGMEQHAVTDDSLINYKSYYVWLLAVALLLLMIELFTSEKRSLQKLRKPTVAVAVMVVFCVSANAQRADNIIRQGNEAYNKAEYDKAAESYGSAVQQDPQSPEAQFNHGNALYKTGKKDDAINAYDNATKLLEKPVEKSNAYYNKGVVLQNDKKLPECIEAYKKALILDPQNEDARQNLQKALQQQKQQQKQKEDKEKKKQDQKNDPNKQPKPQPSKLTRQDAAEKLKALMQQEKNLQDKLHKMNPANVNKPEKDW